jgi:hypothetical protein
MLLLLLLLLMQVSARKRHKGCLDADLVPVD